MDLPDPHLKQIHLNTGFPRLWIRQEQAPRALIRSCVSRNSEVVEVMQTENADGAVDALIPALARRGFKQAPKSAGWEKAKVELRVPPGAKFLRLTFQFIDTCAGRGGSGVHGDGAGEITGQFLDDIQLSLVCNVPIR